MTSSSCGTQKYQQWYLKVPAVDSLQTLRMKGYITKQGKLTLQYHEDKQKVSSCTNDRKRQDSTKKLLQNFAVSKIIPTFAPE